MRPKAGVFCHNGLGDGVNCLALSNNLHLNGWEVDTYQNTIGSMQNWFPHLPVFSYPKLDVLPQVLSKYDWFFVVQNDTDEFVFKLIQEGKRRFPDKLKVLYLYPSPNIVNEPYYSDCLTDPTASIAENMRIVCRNVLHLQKITQGNGFVPPQELTHRKHLQKVVIHPTSGRITRNWPKMKFIELALGLQKDGYEPVFIPGENRDGWQDVGFETQTFSTLDSLASYIYESGYLIGNDSGLGHLASALKIPTLTICRRKAWAKMWAPSFHKAVVVTPHSLIPNIRGMRLRDMHWRKFITVRKVLRGFKSLSSVEESS